MVVGTATYLQFWQSQFKPCFNLNFAKYSREIIFWQSHLNFCHETLTRFLETNHKSYFRKKKKKKNISQNIPWKRNFTFQNEISQTHQKKQNKTRSKLIRITFLRDHLQTLFLILRQFQQINPLKLAGKYVFI